MSMVHMPGRSELPDHFAHGLHCEGELGYMFHHLPVLLLLLVEVAVGPWCRSGIAPCIMLHIFSCSMADALSTMNNPRDGMDRHQQHNNMQLFKGHGMAATLVERTAGAPIYSVLLVQHNGALERYPAGKNLVAIFFCFHTSKM